MNAPPLRRSRFAALLLVEQARENGLRIEPGQAAPDDLAGVVNQRRILAVPDDGKFFEPHRHFPRSATRSGGISVEEIR